MDRWKDRTTKWDTQLLLDSNFSALPQGSWWSDFFHQGWSELRFPQFGRVSCTEEDIGPLLAGLLLAWDVLTASGGGGGCPTQRGPWEPGEEERSVGVPGRLLTTRHLAHV